MEPSEIRAIRGKLSRAAFARLLGVTSLTVLRWELTEGSKEARRPRAKMIETLRRLAADGVGYAERVKSTDHVEDEDEDEDASEPAPEPALGGEHAAPPEPTDPVQREQRLLQPLLDALGAEGWARAEDALLDLLSASTLTTPTGRALLRLGLAQAQLLGRLDVRGALTSLLPVLDDAERDRLPNHVAARAHVLSALLFSAPDSRFFDSGRVNAHVARAEELLEAGQDELWVFLALARTAGARFLNPQVGLSTYYAHASTLDRATSPLARFMALGMRGVAAGLAGDHEASNRDAAAALAIGERLGLDALMVAAMADRAWRTLRGPYTPDAVLSITRIARAKQQAARLPASEPFIRTLACELEALTRLGRVADAHAVAEEALELAVRGGVPRYALAGPIARLYSFTNRTSELEPLARALESDARFGHWGPSNLHAQLVRACAAGLAADYTASAGFAEQVCRAPDQSPGLNYLVHDAYFELSLAKVVLRDFPAADAALAQNDALLEQRPSVWHSAFLLRLAGFTLMHRGRFAEARQKLEASIATLTLVGDVIQLGLAQASLAMLARAAGAPDAAQRGEAARRELQRYCVISPELAKRADMLSVPATGNVWHEQSMPERLVVAIDRLSVRGLPADLVTREMSSIFAQLFPGRELLIGDFDAQDVTEIADSRGLRIAVRGTIDAEQRAALRLLATVAARLPSAQRSSREPETLSENLLPGFIAASPTTRQLKAEIARLSRSAATILISGESGSGKEVVARAVHDLSARVDRPYVVLNCASVPRELFESQLFGHRKGSFTGATADSLGVIRAADGGTLFLDEVGELPLDTQPKLLRFLENGEVLPLGEQKARRVDVRVLAATHRDLSRLVREGTFREDLFYRLNVVPLFVPPLRERKEDVLALARLFVSRLTPDGQSSPELAADSVAALKAHSWPGNVRELRNVIERAMAYTPIPPLLRAEHLRLAPQ
ncbi:MAG TPA: sigma 54-interacting transcriptional regulator [Polyangiaceae bacterium]